MRFFSRKLFAASFLLLVGAMLALTLTQTWDVSMETVLRATMFGGFGFWFVDRANARNSRVGPGTEPTVTASRFLRR